MEVSTVTTAGDNSLLPALRGALESADEAFLAVAFVASPGVHLLAPQLGRLAGKARLLLTTVFQPSSAALLAAHRMGIRVAVMNPPGGTYHPNVYLNAARRGIHGRHRVLKPH